MKSVSERLEQGDDVRAAFVAQNHYFPDLFIDMIAVAEETGTLPEVLKSLADHYENLLKLRRDFLGQIAMPIVQLVASIFIISGVIFVLGMIAESNQTKPFDIMGFGLTGTSGALTFFFGSFGTLFAVWVLYRIIASSASQQKSLHSLFLVIPALGPCLRAFAIARFSWAFSLTQKAGMRVVPSLEASLNATANQAFIGAGPRMFSLIREGEDLSVALSDSNLFPEEFLQMVQVAETSGTVPEMLAHMSPQFEETARRSLKTLSTAVGWCVWALVAAFIIYAIYNMFLLYLGALKEGGLKI